MKKNIRCIISSISKHSTFFASNHYDVESIEDITPCDEQRRIARLMIDEFEVDKESDIHVLFIRDMVVEHFIVEDD